MIEPIFVVIFLVIMLALAIGGDRIRVLRTRILREVWDADFGALMVGFSQNGEDLQRVNPSTEGIAIASQVAAAVQPII